jgi:hypothetical protein
MHRFAAKPALVNPHKSAVAMAGLKLRALKGLRADDVSRRAVAANEAIVAIGTSYARAPHARRAPPHHLRIVADVKPVPRRTDAPSY